MTTDSFPSVQISDNDSDEPFLCQVPNQSQQASTHAPLQEEDCILISLSQPRYNLHWLRRQY